MITTNTEGDRFEKEMHTFLAALCEVGGHEYRIRTEFSELTRDKLQILVSSSLFSGMEVTSRQHFIWEELKKRFGKSILRRITVVYTKSPDERCDEDDIFGGPF